MGKILVTSSHWETLCQAADKLVKENGHEVVLHKGELPYMSFEEIAEVIGDIDGAIIGLDDWTDAVFEIAPKMKAIAKFGVGTDNIDKESATRHGIKVLNAPGVNSGAVAELTIGFMLDMLRQITNLHKQLEQGNWVRYTGNELTGRTIGLLGFGAIAKLVAKKLQGFDVRILASDPYANLEAAKALNVEIVDTDTVLRESDIVSIHVPAMPSTYHMINDEAFAKMKDGSYLINAARGAIVDTQALLRALESGKLAGAALDAFENEPLKADDPLLTCGKVICTPHTGAETKEVYHNVSLCVAQDVINVLAGKEPKNWVNRW